MLGIWYEMGILKKRQILKPVLGIYSSCGLDSITKQTYKNAIMMLNVIRSFVYLFIKKLQLNGVFVF